MHRKIGYYTFFTGLFILAASIPLSKFGTTLGTLLLVLGWLIPFNWKEKYNIIKKSGISILWGIGLFLIFAIGLLYTEDLKFGLKDIKVKLPLLVLPIVLVTGFKPSRKQIITTLSLLSLAGITASIIGYISFHCINHETLDLRALSPFISHIRLSLILVFGVGFGIWLMSQLTANWKWLLTFPLLWIIYFLVHSESLTGIIMLPIVVFWSILMLLKKFPKITFSIGVVCCMALGYGIYEVHKIYSLVFSAPRLTQLKKTESGNQYIHKIKHFGTENGEYILHNLCDKELRPKWNKISNIDFDRKTNGYAFKTIIYRYLSSKHLPKDSLALNSLKKHEIKAIESGVTNWYYVNRNSISKRIHQTFWEIKNAFETKKFQNKSIALRLVYWDIGWELLQNNWLTGVGSGDTKMAFNNAYKARSLDWNEKNKRRSHQQFITTGVALGVFGLCAFIFFLYQLKVKYTGSLKHLYNLSFLILITSFLWEDTLETQAGVSIFSLLIFTLFYEKKHLQNLRDKRVLKAN